MSYTQDNFESYFFGMNSRNSFKIALILNIDDNF